MTILGVENQWWILSETTSSMFSENSEMFFLYIWLGLRTFGTFLKISNMLLSGISCRNINVDDWGITDTQIWAQIFKFLHTFWTFNNKTMKSGYWSDYQLVKKLNKNIGFIFQL